MRRGSPRGTEDERRLDQCARSCRGVAQISGTGGHWGKRCVYSDRARDSLRFSRFRSRAKSDVCICAYYCICNGEMRRTACEVRYEP